MFDHAFVKEMSYRLRSVPSPACTSTGNTLEEVVLQPGHWRSVLFFIPAERLSNRPISRTGLAQHRKTSGRVPTALASVATIQRIIVSQELTPPCARNAKTTISRIISGIASPAPKRRRTFSKAVGFLAWGSGLSCSLQSALS